MTNIALPAWLTPIGNFFGWWVSELAGLLPAALRGLPRETERVIVALDEPDATVSLATKRSRAVLGRVVLGPEGAKALLALFNQHPAARGLPVSLRLPQRAALTVTIELPLVAEANLADVVGFELDRHTPFRADQVYYRHRVIERRPEAQRLVVEVTLAPRLTVERALAAAAALGVTPERVEITKGDGMAAAAEPLTELPGADSRRARVIDRALAVAALLLACALVAVPLVSVHRRAAMLSAEFDAARSRMAAISQLRHEIATLRRNADFLVRLKRRTPPLSQLLDETTHILPDNTWLSEFQIAGGKAELSGCTASASALIGLLERSTTFRDTHFSSSVTRDSARDCEHFSIAAEIKPRAAP